MYLLRTARGELYTGITTDVARRFDQHGTGSGAKFLRGRGPLSLLYTCAIGERGLALRVEDRLKRCSRSEKEAIAMVAPGRRGLLTGLGL